MDRMLSATGAVIATKCIRENCERCSGHMEYERCIDFESDNGYCTFWVLRCLQCGDMVDETILKNRSLSMHRRSPEDRTNTIVPEVHARSHHEFSLT